MHLTALHPVGLEHHGSQGGSIGSAEASARGVQLGASLWSTDRFDGRFAWVLVAVVALYVAGSASAFYGFGADIGLAFFPPAGVTTAALLLAPQRRWPVLVTAVFLTEISIDMTQRIGLAYALGYAIANAVEPVAGVLVFRRLNPAGVFLNRRRGKLSYIFGACGVGALVGALVGGTVATSHRPGTEWISNVAHWWAGDGLAILVIGAGIVFVLTTKLARRQWLELGGLSTAIGIVGLVSLEVALPPSTIVLPLLIMSAFRLGAAGATIGGAVYAIVANYKTNAGSGYFAEVDTSVTSQLALLQVFVAVLIIVAWSVGVEVLARVEATAQSRDLERERDLATAAVEAIHHAVRPTASESAGPFEVGASYRQTALNNLVGGDWFDAFDLPDGRVLFAVGDVVGHGVNAMQDMAHLRLASRAFATEGHSPARILAHLNRFTIQSTTGGYATMVLAAYEPRLGSLTLASAGHPPPILRAGQRSSEPIALRPGPPLGAATAATYPEVTLTMDTGDALVLYSDGVIERRGHPLDEGMDQLRAALDAPDLAALTANDICDRLVDECFPLVPAEDDRCVLVIRLGAPASRRDHPRTDIRAAPPASTSSSA